MAKPVKKPLAPSECAPAKGWATRETAPAITPLETDLTADDTPAIASFGRRVEKSVLNNSLACKGRKI